MDTWYPLGKADMLEIAQMAIVFGRMLSEKKKHKVFDSITYGGARALSVEGYGIAKGKFADLVVLQAADPMEAIRIKAARLAVVRRGKIISRQEKRTANPDARQQDSAARLHGRESPRHPLVIAAAGVLEIPMRSRTPATQPDRRGVSATGYRLRWNRSTEGSLEFLKMLAIGIPVALLGA